MSNNGVKKTVVVVGASGGVGRTIVETLTAQGHVVRRVARSAGASFDDTSVLDAAFTGTDSAFLMIPFDMSASDLHRREAEIATRLTEAVTVAKVRRVICLSGTSARLGADAGSGRGAAMLEEQLNRRPVSELVHLRACFLMENFFQGIPQILDTGIFRWPFRQDIATPMMAKRDVGNVAAALLIEEPFGQPRVRELLGPRDYTMTEATGILASAVGRRDVRYARISYDEARAEMIRGGVSSSFADAVMETARSFNGGVTWAQEARSSQNTTPTTFEQWAEEVFAPMYRAAEDRNPHRA